MRNTQGGGLGYLQIGPEEGTFWIIRHISFVTVPDPVTGASVPIFVNWDGTPFSEEFLVQLDVPAIETLNLPTLAYIPVGYPHTLTFAAGRVDDLGFATCTMAGDMGVGSLPMP
jgi:hypothetical protein